MSRIESKNKNGLCGCYWFFLDRLCKHSSGGNPFKRNASWGAGKSIPVSPSTQPGQASGQGTLTAKQAVALAEVEAKKALGEAADVVTIHGDQDGTTVDGKATNWDILFANPEGKTLYVAIENGQITQTRGTHSDVILTEASGENE